MSLLFRITARLASLLAMALLLAGCKPEPREEFFPAMYSIGLNHTKNSIIRYHLSTGASGRVPPFAESGNMPGGGSYPKVWRPDFTVEVSWTVDTDPFAHWRWSEEGKKFSDMIEAHEALYQQHTATVVPWPYGEDTCGVIVHFLPCNQVAIQLACYDQNNPDNPYAPPLRAKKMEEPEVCP